MTDVTTWQRIVRDRPPDAAYDLAVSRLLDARWFSLVGQPSSRDGEVDRAASWDDACAMFTTPDGSSATGTLDAAADSLIALLDRNARLVDLTTSAANHALELVRVSAHIPIDFPLVTSIAIDDYVTEFVRLLVIEIYVGDVGRRRCTYFRDQLPWFVAGFFPCGWSGTWPVGRMRVF